MASRDTFSVQIFIAGKCQEVAIPNAVIKTCGQVILTCSSGENSRVASIGSYYFIFIMSSEGEKDCNNSADEDC
jgi:hypothetical protein